MAGGPDARWRPRDLLPVGVPLAPAAMRGRHRLITVSLLLAAIATAGVAWVLGSPVEAGLAGVIGLVLLALADRPATRPTIMAVAAIGTALAVLNVHVTATTEAHFLFFVLIPLLALYEDRAAFATTVVLVTAHHLVGGLLWPTSVFAHPAAQASPLPWTLLHVGLLGLVVLTTLIHWGAHERARRRADSLLTELTAEARRDPLTGCANRRALDERLTEELGRAAREGRPVAVLTLDIDGFKPLNDTYGHTVGDEVLVELAGRIGAQLRGSDLLARVGGDEFVMVLPGAEATEAKRAADRAIAAASRPYDVAPERPVGASVGIAIGEPGADAGDLLQLADEAMYEAKRRGRGSAVVAGRDLPDTDAGVLVSPADARVWARDLRAQREEIAVRKEQGRVPAAVRAPTSVHRTLQTVLAAIDQLPDAPRARLPLPDLASVEEFVFHHAGVQAWIDGLVAEGTLEHTTGPAARRFWQQLVDGIEMATVRSGVIAAALERSSDDVVDAGCRD